MRSRWSAIVRVLVAVLGLGLLAWTVEASGPEAVAALLLAAAVWVPVAGLLELWRIAMDAVSTRLLLGERARAVPWTRLVLAHVAAHGVMNVFPAGRGTSEVLKSALLSPWLGVGPAVAMGTGNQANVLIASALFSLPCALAAALVTDEPRLWIAILIHFAVLFAAGVGMRVAATNEHVETFFRRRFPNFAPRLETFHAASRESALVAWGPVLAMFAGRAIQTLEYAVLAHAVGIDVGVLSALAVQGTNLVAAAVGVFVPGQLGSAEAIFAVAAEALGTTAARATSVALLAHAISFFWVAVGLGVVGVWRGGAPEAETAPPAG